jgi:hypothetical protein
LRGRDGGKVFLFIDPAYWLLSPTSAKLACNWSRLVSMGAMAPMLSDPNRSLSAPACAALGSA